MRLHKFLARAGVCSRRQGERLIQEGHVAVNGRTVTTLGTVIDPAHDHVTVDGRSVAVESTVVVLLHKPDAIVCAAGDVVDERGRSTVLSLIRDVPQRVYPVGRLDYHTRGLLLLTNDGDLAALLTHPRHKVPKTYHVKFQGKLDLPALEALRTGVTLDDGARTQPVENLFVLEETRANTWVRMTLTQGLNRQIRRMGESVGHTVLKLVRVALGPLDLGDLPEGAHRLLTAGEISALRDAAVPKPPRGAYARRAKRSRPR